MTKITKTLFRTAVAQHDDESTEVINVAIVEIGKMPPFLTLKTEDDSILVDNGPQLDQLIEALQSAKKKFDSETF